MAFGETEWTQCQSGTRPSKDKENLNMARIKALEQGQFPSKAVDTLQEIEQAFGRIPNLFKTYAHHPALLKANWDKVKAIMMQGVLSRKVKETIAVLVSKDNSCNYCVAAHTVALKSIGTTDDEIRRIEQDVAQADFNPKEKALIALARKANLEPLRIADAEFDSLLQAGVSDTEIIEALGVMEVFTAFNKFLDALQIEIDF
jgi:uncharacterized peroxidase-related enzyme